MWFRIFVASWSGACFALLGWLATHQSSEPSILGRYSPRYFGLLLGTGVLVTVSLLAQTSFLYRRLHRLRREITLALSSIVFSVIALEVVIRMVDPFGVSYFQENLRYQLDKLPDPLLVYKHAPGLRRTYQGVDVAINQLGFRDRELEKKRDNELRILLLGDSVTFGWGVPIEATFGRTLERILTARIGRPVRVINTGVGGYNTVQEYAVLRAYADAIEPDIVVLLYVFNDIETNDPPFDPSSQVSLSGTSPPESMAILLGRSWLYRLGSFAWRYSHSDGPTGVDHNARGVRESLAALSAIATWSRKHGMNFVTFFYRPKDESSGVFWSSLLSEVQTTGQNNGFPVVDVGSWWIEADMRSVTNSRIDSHPNVRGHEIIAIGMADWLTTQGLINTTVAAVP